MILRPILAILLSACPHTAAYAQPMFFGTHVGSYHYSSKAYNNVNVGWYVIERSGLTSGTYSNSYGPLTAYVGKYLTPLENTSWLVGAATGYPGKAVQPMLMYTYKMPIDSSYGLRFGATYLRGGGFLMHMTFELASFN